MKKSAAILYTIITLGVVAFQIALAAGVPWGDYAMGGAFPGQFPPEMRVAAIIQAILLSGLAAVILAHAGLAFPRLIRMSRWLSWVVVGFAALSLILNLITPNPLERAIWAPVALLMLISSAIVTFSKSTQTTAG